MKPLLYASALGLFAFIAWGKIKTDWEYVGRDRDIDVYKAEIKGTKIVGFKGVSVLDAPLPKVLALLYAPSRMEEWMTEIRKVKVLERMGKFEKIEYNITRAPWPLSDRDFVYSVKLHKNKDGSVMITVENAEHPAAPPKKGLVRGKLYPSRYFLRPLENKKTHFEIELLADPMGSVPKWLVNLTQKSWPINTIQGLKEVLSDPNLEVDPDIAGAFEKLK